MSEYLSETPFIPPPHVKEGLLPSPLGYAPLLRNQADFETIPPSQWASIIEATKPGLSRYAYHCLDQDGIGSCASETVINTTMLLREQAGLPRVVGNPWPTYRYAGGGADRGSTLQANLELIRTRGMVPMELWDRSHNFRETVPQNIWDKAKKYRGDEYFEVTNWAEFGTALILGYAIQWGYTGHSITGTDLINDNQFWYFNSWSEDWGNPPPLDPIDGGAKLTGGFGIANSSRIRWGYGVYAHRSVIVEVDI